jgi:hypothetical protein
MLQKEKKKPEQAEGRLLAREQAKGNSACAASGRTGAYD